MSDAENPIPPLPDAKTFLEGKDGIKPLQHKADALTQFAVGFEEVPLAPKAAETVVQLGDVMKKPHWAGAHDAAHDAISTARKLVTENPSEDLSKLSYMVESVGNARAPHVDTVKGIKHPVLEEALKPLVTYLEEFGNFITGWAGLSPSRMRPKGEDTMTPAAHRATTQAALDNIKASNPDAVIPECGDVNCTIEHGVEGHKPPPEAPPVNDGHVHGASCNHDHPTPPPASSGGGHVHGPGCGHDHAPTSSSGGGTHYHGDTPCSHSHPHTPGGGAHEPHLPKGTSKTGLWVAGIAAVVGVGAYLINEYGKPDKKKEDAPKPKDWKARVEPAASSEARTL